MIAISHDMRFVAETFERVVVMRAGRDHPRRDTRRGLRRSQLGTLASTYLEPPLAARVGARLGLGSTPTEQSLVEALSRMAAPD